MEVLERFNQLLDHSHKCLMLMEPTSAGSQQWLRCSLCHLFLQHSLLRLLPTVKHTCCLALLSSIPDFIHYSHKTQHSRQEATRF